jgi:hypothetical protein
VIATAILGIQFAAAIVLAIILVRRRVHRKLPFFSTYVIYSIAATALQWACVSHQQLYFTVYWLTEAGDVALAVAATCESFITTFRGFFVLAWFRWLLPALAVTVAIYAGWKAWIHPPVLNSTMAALVVGLEIGLRYFIAGVFFLYVASRRYVKISNSGFQYNVLLGFFLASVGMLLAAVLRSEFGTNFRLMIAWAAPVGYSAALCVWISSLITTVADEKQKGTAGPQVTAASAIQVLTQYSSVLKKARK